MQIKTIVRDHLTLVIIAIIKKATNWGLVVRILGFLFFFFWILGFQLHGLGSIPNQRTEILQAKL